MTPGHVVHVVRSDAFAGVERYIVDTADELTRRGWRVSVIGGDPDRMRAELPAGVRYRPAATVLDVAAALWRTGRCDVVHAHMTAAELPAALFARRAGARLVVTRHFARRRSRSLPGRLAGAFVARRVDARIAISRYVAEAIGGPSTVIHNGVRSGRAEPTVRSETVLVMQRLEREKDTRTALRAWAAAGLAERGWRMVICGRGSELDELRALAGGLGVDDSVEFAGFVDDPRTRLAAASILLAPTPAEGFGFSVVEAMAEGTPVVASGGGAHAEILGPEGLLFPPGDDAACAMLLNRLADSTELRADLGRRLRARQRGHFTIAAHVELLEAVYTR